MSSQTSYENIKIENKGYSELTSVLKLLAIFFSLSRASVLRDRDYKQDDDDDNDVYFFHFSVKVSGRTRDLLVDDTYPSLKAFNHFHQHHLGNELSSQRYRRAILHQVLVF